MTKKLTANEIDTLQRDEVMVALEKNDLGAFTHLVSNLRAKTFLVELYNTSIDKNNLEAVKILDQFHAKDRYVSSYPHWVIHAIKHNKMEFFQHFYQQMGTLPDGRCKPTKILEMLISATNYNIQPMIDYLHQDIKKSNLNLAVGYVRLLRAAANNNHEKLYFFWVNEFLKITPIKEQLKKLKDGVVVNAVRGGNFSIVQHLVETLKVKELNDGLYEAVKRKNTVVFEYLLQHGADINSEKGRILRWSTLQQDKEIVKYLIKTGATPKIDQSTVTSPKKNYNQMQALVEVCAMELEYEANKTLSVARVNKL